MQPWHYVVVASLLGTACLGEITAEPYGEETSERGTSEEEGWEGTWLETDDAGALLVEAGSFRARYYRRSDFRRLAREQFDASIDFDWGVGAPFDDMPADGFSVRWEGDFDFVAGTYVFSASSDDGMRIFVDGKLLVDHWGDHALSTLERSAHVAGRHRVRVDYFERAGRAVARVDWRLVEADPSSPEGGIVMSTPLSLDKSEVRIGETLRGSVTYTNTSSAPLTLREVVIAGRPPGAVQYLDLTPKATSVTLQPGASYTLSASRTFVASDLVGQWRSFPTYQDADGEWHDGPETNFTVLAGGSSHGFPTRVLATYYAAWDGSYAITDIPLDFNVIYLFHLTPAGPNPDSNNNGDGTFEFKHWYNVSPAQVQQVRARGQKVILTVGGANNGFNFDQRYESQNFVSSFNALAAQLGGVDGCDFNNFEANVGSSPTEMVWIAQQLRATYGPDFAITAPPQPNSSADMAMLSAMANAGVLTYAAPQYYDWSGFKADHFVADRTQAWVNLLGANRVMLGLSANYSYGTSLTLQESLREWDYAIAANPDLRGAFCWNAQTNLAGGNAWGAAFGDRLGR